MCDRNKAGARPSEMCILEGACLFFALSSAQRNHLRTYVRTYAHAHTYVLRLSTCKPALTYSHDPRGIVKCVI